MSSPADARLDALGLAVDARRLAHGEARNVEHVHAEIEDREMVDLGKIGCLPKMSWPVREETRAQVGLPIVPDAMTSRALRTGARKRVFSCTMKGTPAAVQPSTIETQSSQVGAGGFCTIVGSL